MQTNSFAALGVSAELAATLDARGIASPFEIQTRGIPPALAGTDLLAKSPTGSGKTLAFVTLLVERGAPGRRAPRRARPRPDARAVRPRRYRGDRVARRPPGPHCRVRVRRRLVRPQARPARDAHVIVADARPSPGPWSIPGSSRSTRSRSSSPTRPTECSTWASSHKSTESSSGCRASARRCSSPRHSTARSASSPGVYPVSGTHRGRGCPARRRLASTTTTLCRSPPTRRSRSSSSCSPPNADSHSSSFARSAAPTALRGS